MLKEEFIDIFVANMQKTMKTFLECNASSEMQAFNEEILSKNNNSRDATNIKLAKLSSCIARVNDRIIFDFTDNEQASREVFDVRKELMRSINTLADELYKQLPKTKEKTGFEKLKQNLGNNLKAKLGKNIVPPDYNEALKLLQSQENSAKLIAFTFTLLKSESMLLLGVKPKL